MMLLCLLSIVLTCTSDVIARESVSSRRADDANLQSLMTLVQRQAETIQKQEASLQTMQNQITNLQRSVSNNSDTLRSLDSRLNTQVFFTAHMTKYVVTMGQNSPLLFDSVVNNVGGGYQTSTGVFTAPVSGVYVFYAQLMKHADTPFFHWAIDQDGTALCSNSGDTQNSYDKASCLVTARLTRGQQVSVRRLDDGAPGYTLEGSRWCSFSGYLTSVDA